MADWANAEDKHPVKTPVSRRYDERLIGDCFSRFTRQNLVPA
jgi:hypothetical protein